MKKCEIFTTKGERTNLKPNNIDEFHYHETKTRRQQTHTVIHRIIIDKQYYEIKKNDTILTYNSMNGIQINGISSVLDSLVEAVQNINRNKHCRINWTVITRVHLNTNYTQRHWNWSTKEKHIALWRMRYNASGKTTMKFVSTLQQKVKFYLKPS